MTSVIEPAVLLFCSTNTTSHATYRDIVFILREYNQESVGLNAVVENSVGMRLNIAYILSTLHTAATNKSNDDSKAAQRMQHLVYIIQKAIKMLTSQRAHRCINSKVLTIQTIHRCFAIGEGLVNLRNMKMLTMNSSNGEKASQNALNFWSFFADSCGRYLCWHW